MKIHKTASLMPMDKVSDLCARKHLIQRTYAHSNDLSEQEKVSARLNSKARSFSCVFLKFG